MKNQANDGYTIQTPSQLGAVLQGYRKQARLTQAQVARTVGLPQSGISELESDPSTASLSRIFKLLGGLDLELVVRRRSMAKNSEW